MKNTRIVLQNLVVFLMLNTGVACSRAGMPDAQPAGPEERPSGADSVTTDDDHMTRVGFELYPDMRWRYPVCEEMKVTPVSGLEAPPLDGDLSDWETRPFRLSDPQDDDAEGRDILSLGIDLVSGGDLYLAIAAARQASDELHIELGVISAVSETSYVERSLRYLRWINGSLEWWQDGSWQPLPSNDLANAVGEANVEMRLSRLFIGELLAYPAWFVKVSARSGGTLLDVVSPAYLPGTMTGIDQRLSVSACQLGQARLTLLRERAVSSEMAEEFFRIARFAYGKFNAAWGTAQQELSDATYLLGGTDLSVSREPLDSLVVQHKNVAQVFALPRHFTDASDPTLRATLFRQIFSGLVERSFAAAAPGLSESLRMAMSKAWSVPVLESEIGKHGFLASYWEDVSGFLAGGDTSAAFKPLAWGHLLAAMLPQSALQVAWQLCQTCEDDDLFRLNLIAALPTEDQHLVERLWAGWHDGAPHDPSSAPSLLEDGDGDGLPAFMENRLSTAVELIDSDKDGWSDYAEWIFGSDGRNALVHPSTLSVDGLLGDWRDLMPTRIKADPDDATDECGGTGDIEDFVALADQDAIIVSAKVSEDFPNPVPVSFEVIFDFPDDRRKFSLQAETGARYWQVREEKSVTKTYLAPFVVGQHGFEVAFRASDFGLTRDLRDEQVVNMRINTSVMRASRLHCDDTPWFRPLIRDNRP